MGRHPSQLILISESPDEVVFQVADGRRFKVSPCDKMLVLGRAWSMDKNGYIRCGSPKHHNKLLSRLLCPTDFEVDHKDRDPSNNRRDNLRPATHIQNQANSRGSSRTGFKGVYPNKDRFAAAITVNYSKVHLGTFDTPEEAHMAYMEAAAHYRGDFACDGHPI